MTSSLTLTYEFSRDDDFGWLQAKVLTPKVGGDLGFWVQWQDIEEWAGRLSRYPITLDSPLRADWGQSDDDGGNYQAIVKVTVAAIDAAGHLEVLVNLSDQYDRRHHCQAVFRTTYVELERFAAALRAMMARAGCDAVLTGNDIG
ncbi:MAG: hypothetical protein P0Y59_14940 [Candidatus Sphingomonas phytovorans]|nr:hypothetical protein [Sphingomonas sp.]WEJ98238.1 MAG: hypothetical protein P0Y59_14940 [Sphingomonas sp.]